MIEYIPIFIEKYNIYDIFYNIYNKNLVIISPCEGKPLEIKINNIKFNLIRCPDNHTYIYIIKNINININVKELKIYINNNLLITKYNIYVNLKNKILMSTIVKNEEKYIKQWITYHKNIGIDYFIIYNNENNNKLKTYLNTFENKNIILIKWNYPYRLKNGISGQTIQQNHSIYVFTNVKYIGLLDIDEYVNPQKINNIDLYFSNIIKKNNININKISSFQLHNKNFYNPEDLSTENYNFLKIYNCDIIETKNFEKHFVIPKNVIIFSVHKVLRGLPVYKTNINEIFFNHYRFLNKVKRGRDKTLLKDNSIIKNCLDKYFIKI